MEVGAEEGYYTPDEQEIITYGMERWSVFWKSTVVVVGISVLLGVLPQGILFLLTFVPLRMYAGGYHADAEWKCYLSSTVIVLISLFVMKYWGYAAGFGWFAAAISSVIIFLMAPVDNGNKRLEEVERTVYRKRTRIIFLCESGLLIAAAIWQQDVLCAPIIDSFCIVASSLAMGRVKNYKEKK